MQISTSWDLQLTPLKVTITRSLTSLGLLLNPTTCQSASLAVETRKYLCLAQGRVWPTGSPQATCNLWGSKLPLGSCFTTAHSIGARKAVDSTPPHSRCGQWVMQHGEQVRGCAGTQCTSGEEMTWEYSTVGRVSMQHVAQSLWLALEQPMLPSL